MAEINMEIAHISKEIGIVETVIRKNGQTIFAVYKNGEIEYKDEIALPTGQKIIPLSSGSDMITSEAITLPPKPIEYGSEEELFDDLRTFVGKYFATNKGFLDVIALYIMLTWVYERFNDLPYLRVIGTLGTGKSRFLKVVNSCSYNSLMLGSATVAAMFRTIDKFRGTFVLDEADYKNSEFSSEVAKILNNGNTKGAPVARMREKTNSDGDFSTEFFQVFGPKVLASRESFNDAALESRCFSQRLYPNKRIKAHINLDKAFWEDARALRGKLLSFRFRNFDSMDIRELRSETIGNFRILQVAQPLWNIGLLINQKVAQDVIEQAVILDTELVSSQSDLQEADVLISIMKLWIDVGDKIYIRTICRKYFQLYGTGSKNSESDMQEGITVFDYKSDLSDRKTGEIVGRVLHIKKHRDNKGIYILKDASTKSVLKNLCRRYGITRDIIYS